EGSRRERKGWRLREPRRGRPSLVTAGTREFVSSSPWAAHPDHRSGWVRLGMVHPTVSRSSSRPNTGKLILAVDVQAARANLGARFSYGLLDDGLVLRQELRSEETCEVNAIIAVRVERGAKKRNGQLANRTTHLVRADTRTRNVRFGDTEPCHRCHDKSDVDRCGEGLERTVVKGTAVYWIDQHV